MNLPKIFLCLPLLALLTLISCTGGSTQADEKNKIEQAQILGSWEVTEATRNGVATETLDGLFFRFTKEGMLTTNLLGNDMETPYELEGNKIHQKGVPTVEYTIDNLDARQLMLSTTLEKFNFKLTLDKVED